MEKILTILIIIVTFCSGALGDILEDMIKKKIDNFMSRTSIPAQTPNISYEDISNRTVQNISPSNNYDDMIGLGAEIHDSTYILGTGDGLQIHIWGTVNTDIQSTIDYEGNCILPKIGIVYLKGFTLLDGKKLLGAKLQEFYKSVEYSIELSKIGQFKVYVIGEVKKTGSYIINGGNRVSDVIEMADGKTATGSLRNITITNSENKVTGKADLLLLLKNNDNSKNPFLNEGDRIYVSKINETVSICGAVQYPGSIDYDSTDSLFTIIRLAGGLARGADSSKIIVSRFGDDKDSLATYSCSFLDSSVYSFRIQKDDRIFVFSKPYYRIPRSVSIKGEVVNPGKYPIKKDTRLKDVIQMAGGFTNEADLKMSRLIRSDKIFAGDREFEKLQKIPSENLSPTQKEYMVSRLLGDEGRVCIDFNDFNSDDFSNFIVHDSDEIIIEKKASAVKVIGAVINPGLVIVKENEGVDYYIRQAGGYNPRAQEGSVKVMRNGREIWKKKSKVRKLESGDVIWVPEKYYHNPYSTAKDVILTIGSIATIIISALTIKSYLDGN